MCAGDRRQSVLKLKRHTIDCPTLWLGHDQKHPFKVWKYVDDCECVMVNASQLFERAGFRRLASGQGIQAALEHKGAIFMDSGGYQFQRNGRCNVETKAVLDLYKRVHPDIAAVLDVPLNPSDSASKNYRRWQKTIRNTAEMYEGFRRDILVPILHGYSLSVIHRRYEELNNIVCFRQS